MEVEVRYGEENLYNTRFFSFSCQSPAVRMAMTPTNKLHYRRYDSTRRIEETRARNIKKVMYKTPSVHIINNFGFMPRAWTRELTENI